MTYRLLIALAMSIGTAACGGGGGGGGGGGTLSDPAGGGSGDGSTSSDPCGVSAQIDFIESTAKTFYYWDQELAELDKANFDNPQTFLDALTAPVRNDGSGREKLGFNYVTTVTADQAAITNRSYYGFGFRYELLDNGNTFYFSDTFEESPAYVAGLRRGQRLISVDRGAGFETWESLVADGVTPSEIFGPSDSPVTRVFKVDDAGTERDIEVTKAEVNTPPIAGEPLLIARAGNSPVGYLHFRTFIRAAYDATLPAYPENYPLPVAARTFKDAGVTDLIIDLRYNSGGLLDVTRAFLDLLAGSTADGERSYILKVNDNPDNDYQDDIRSFSPLPDTFEPIRIAFIVTDATASASELLINALDPHIEVALVGGPETFGKAVGQSRFDMPDCEHAIRLISFEIQNGLGQGGYWNGLVDTGRFTLYPAIDDLTTSFGNVNEDSLEAALAWLNGDLAKLSRLAAKPRQTQPRRIAPFDAVWPIDEVPPLNPDGSVRSF